ncbi:hypothetical protein [Crossiella cryophila]|uniref:Lipoprotein n=1 Tax=Crossiella cryophila TaxID=43355 RepID=A0A7W7FS86_9PSEU|nr:hypothetical protein [Crossiella cryophila]MBB4675158.1 hypothetical protein [Crossiella cryophila]
MKVRLFALATLLLLGTSACTVRFYTSTTEITPTAAPDPAAATWLAKSCALSLPVVSQKQQRVKELDESALPEERARQFARLYRDMAGWHETARKAHLDFIEPGPDGSAPFRLHWIALHEENQRVLTEVAPMLERAKITAEADLKLVRTDVDAIIDRSEKGRVQRNRQLSRELPPGFVAAFHTVPACKKLG